MSAMSLCVAQEQFTAVLGLFIDLALFFAVRAMLAQELEREEPEPDT